jgi:hypothetical protein
VCGACAREPHPCAKWIPAQNGPCGAALAGLETRDVGGAHSRAAGGLCGGTAEDGTPGGARLGKILVDTRRLLASFVAKVEGPDRFRIYQGMNTSAPSVRDGVSRFHQFGSRHIPKRPMVPRGRRCRRPGRLPSSRSPGWSSVLRAVIATGSPPRANVIETCITVIVQGEVGRAGERIPAWQFGSPVVSGPTATVGCSGYRGRSLRCACSRR